MSLGNKITSLYGTMATEMLLDDIIKNSSLLKFVTIPQRFRMYILHQHNGLCMHNFFYQNVQRNVVFLLP